MTARESLLLKVRSRTALHARRKVRTILDGEHTSIHKGRSLDFDDLREYVAGDDVKDIDWKATARHGSPLVKRYVAVRQQSILFVVDAGRSMAGLADATSTKRDTAVMATGIVGQLVLQRGDVAGLVCGPFPGEDPIRYIAPAAGDAHLERLLRTVYDGIDADGPPSAVDGLLNYVSRHIRRRMILVIIVGDRRMGRHREELLRRLHAQHEIIYLTVDDPDGADLAELEATDRLRLIETGGEVPAFFRRNRRLADGAEAPVDEAGPALRRLGIAAGQLAGESSAYVDVIRNLERHRRVGR